MSHHAFWWLWTFRRDLLPNFQCRFTPSRMVNPFHQFPYWNFHQFGEIHGSFIGVTRWGSWSRHCATNRRVAASITDGITGIFQWLNPSGRIVALGSTQPLTEMSTRNPSWGKRRPVLRADNLTTFMCRLSRNSGASTSWNPKGLSRPVAGKFYVYLVQLSGTTSNSSQRNNDLLW
jgi:hypothetical protein